jgi:hypothetical protein
LAGIQITGYNKWVQNHIVLWMEVIPTMQLLDCRKIEVHLKNRRYEGFGEVKAEEGYRGATNWQRCGEWQGTGESGWEASMRMPLS